MKRGAAAGAASMALNYSLFAGQKNSQQPNIILIMADDMGYGDVAYYGNEYAVTPNLDQMAKEGIRFDRFYSGGPVCSPTRGSCLTGRHPRRYGIDHANRGYMKPEELTIAEVLREQGYRTGHFGKWHVGTLTTEIKDGNRGGSPHHYSPPWMNGFDVCFSTESKVPTYDPAECPEGWEDFKTCDNGTWACRFWKEDGTYETENLDGDSSKVTMDRALPFIRESVQSDTPFLAVIWFHTPHDPIVGNPDYMPLHENHCSPEIHSVITAMDAEIGRLNEELKSLGVYDNTMQWFCSDNGPTGGCGDRTAGLAKNKGSLHEGGVRVPGILIWPEMVPAHFSTQVPSSTSDYFPTILSALGLDDVKKVEPIDGIDLMPLIRGEMSDRPRPIGFKDKRGKMTLVDNRYKLHWQLKDGEPIRELYDLVQDREEKTDIASQHPQIVAEMESILLTWEASCERSAAGEDYVSTASRNMKIRGQSVYLPAHEARNRRRFNLLGRGVEGRPRTITVKDQGKRKIKEGVDTR
jgi:arylsulfatase A-like enzyme